MNAKFKLNEEYDYPVIEKYRLDRKFTEEEHGIMAIGENFLVIKNPKKDQVISFMMIGWKENGGVYKCIYTDL